MRNTLVPVLLLATVALSSSNILPIVSMREKPDLRYGQSNDNIFSSKHQSSDDTNNLFYKIDFDNLRPDTRKVFENHYENPNNNFDEENNPPNKDIYDVKGFRKEQWHNYPRQLDRLNKYLYEHFNSDKRNLEPDDPGEYDESPQNDITSNEIHLDGSFDPHKPVDEVNKAAAIMNPLIVLKIHLACLNKDVQFSRFPDRASSSEFNQLGHENEDYANNLSDDNPKSNVGKVKREGKTKLEIAESTQHEPKNRMNKRIFSLWSRLQSLNHKGHELHHRRHLYALYGLPDSEGGGGGGVLTAETRATFMRPPGSPLRWG